MAYSDVEKAAATVKLAASGYNYDAVARELAIPERTLRRWDKQLNTGAAGGGVIVMLEAALVQLLEVVPEDLSGAAWATTVGILLDKWLVAQGLAQPAGLGVEGEISALTMRITGLNDDEFWRVWREAEQHLDGVLAASSVADGTGGAEPAD